MLDKDAKPTMQNAQVRQGSKVSRQPPSSRTDAPPGKLTLQQGEPADAFVTGCSRSLQRRCLGLNLPVPPATVAAAKKPVTRPTAIPAH